VAITANTDTTVAEMASAITTGAGRAIRVTCSARAFTASAAGGAVNVKVVNADTGVAILDAWTSLTTPVGFAGGGMWEQHLTGSATPLRLRMVVNSSVGGSCFAARLTIEDIGPSTPA
jgi:hypothetical protein